MLLELRNAILCHLLSLLLYAVGRDDVLGGGEMEREK